MLKECELKEMTGKKEESLSTTIGSYLDEITENSADLSIKLEKLDAFIFGPSNESPKDEKPKEIKISSWKNDILNKLTTIQNIINKQHKIFAAISKLYI